MAPRILLSLTIVFLAACQSTPTIRNSQQFAFIDSLLAKESYNAELLQFDVPQDVQAITMQMQQNIEVKQEWFQDYYLKNFKEGQDLPYHKNFGITPEQYQKVIDAEKALVPVVLTAAPVKASRKNQVLTFATTEDDLQYLQDLTIDFKHELITFKKDTVPFAAVVNAPDSTPFGEWTGYAWKKDLTENNYVDTNLVDSKFIEIEFGKVKSNGKTLVHIKFKEVQHNMSIANRNYYYYLN